MVKELVEKAYGGEAVYKGLLPNPISSAWSSPGEQDIGTSEDPDTKKTKITNYVTQVLLFDKPLEGDVSVFAAAISGSETLKYSVLAPDDGFAIVSPETIAKAIAAYEAINTSVKQYIAEKKGDVPAAAAEAAPAQPPAQPPAPPPVSAAINVTNDVKYAEKIAELETKQLSPYTIEWMDSNRTALYKDEAGNYEIVQGTTQDEILAALKARINSSQIAQ
jgi:hypothetical protein